MRVNLDHWFSAEGVNEAVSEDLIDNLNREAFVLHKLKDRRWGIIFSKGSQAKQTHRKLQDLYLDPTRMVETKYGFAYKFNDPIERAKKIDAIGSKIYYPYSLMTKKLQGWLQDGYAIFEKNENLNYQNFNEKTGRVGIMIRTPLKSAISYSLKNYWIPYPPTKSKGGRITPVLTIVKSLGKPFSPTSTSQFIHYSQIEIGLNFETGKWNSKESRQYHPIGKDKLSDFLLELNKTKL